MYMTGLRIYSDLQSGNITQGTDIANTKGMMNGPVACTSAYGERLEYEIHIQSY